MEKSNLGKREKCEKQTIRRGQKRNVGTNKDDKGGKRQMNVGRWKLQMGKQVKVEKSGCEEE